MLCIVVRENSRACDIGGEFARRRFVTFVYLLEMDDSQSGSIGNQCAV
jgi:hypothetical protein